MKTILFALLVSTMNVFASGESMTASCSAINSAQGSDDFRMLDVETTHGAEKR